MITHVEVSHRASDTTLIDELSERGIGPSSCGRTRRMLARREAERNGAGARSVAGRTSTEVVMSRSD